MTFSFGLDLMPFTSDMQGLPINVFQIYWFGPTLGALLGALLYDIVFATDASFTRVRSCMLANEKRKNTPSNSR